MKGPKNSIGSLVGSTSSAVKVAVPRILESEVKTTHLLGEGAYGQVWKGTCRSNPVAVKYIHPEKYNPESFLAELTILFQANNRHIVQLQGVLMNEKDQPSGIVTEYLDGGDLEAVLHPEGSSKNVPKAQKIKWAIDICKGMGWLAGKEPANIMLDRDHKTCKICDFGLAVAAEGKRGKHQTGDTKSTRGSPLWMAPERVVNKVIKEKELVEELKDKIEAYRKETNLDKMVNINSSEKSDVYSFGVMFWEMLTEAWPYVDLISTESYSELFAVILAGKRPSLEGIEPELAKIISACWHQNPDKRPQFSEAVVMLQQALVTLDLPTNVCPDAASWWIKYFTLEAHSASVADIAQEAVTDGYVPEAMCETVLVCMYGLLTGKVVDLPPEISEHKVTTEDLGKILKWFGPLKGEGLLNMVSMMQTPGFFGLIEKTETENLLMRHEVDKTFLVRLNTGANVSITSAPFVVSVYIKGSKASCLHIRTFPRAAGKWLCQVGSEKIAGASLMDLLENLKKKGTIKEPLEPSPFTPLWSENAISGGLYSADLLPSDDDF